MCLNASPSPAQYHILQAPSDMNRTFWNKCTQILDKLKRFADLAMIFHSAYIPLVNYVSKQGLSFEVVFSAMASTVFPYWYRSMQCGLALY